jgi:hypothetical protein
MVDIIFKPDVVLQEGIGIFEQVLEKVLMCFRRGVNVRIIC